MRGLFFQTGAEERRWQALTLANSAVAALQHALGDFSGADATTTAVRMRCTAALSVSFRAAIAHATVPCWSQSRCGRPFAAHQFRRPDVGKGLTDAEEACSVRARGGVLGRLRCGLCHCTAAKWMLWTRSGTSSSLQPSNRLPT